jgi:hypothetical protein
VGGDAIALQQLKQVGGDLAVELAFARQLGLLEGVEGGGVVLVFHGHQVRLVGGKHALGLAFVEQRSEGDGGHGGGLRQGRGVPTGLAG